MKIKRAPVIMALITGGLIMTTILLPQFRDSLGRESAPETSTPAELSPSVLTAHLEMGPSALNVRDLSQQTEFYSEVVGLQVLEQSEDETLLGWNERPVLHLYGSSLPDFPRTSAGLYHTAILFASRSELAHAVQRVVQQRPELFSGTSDHIVSEAFYFSDPEGNGLELYFDKDPAGWVWRNGRVQMGSSYIDPLRYIETFRDEGGSPEKKMGHMHLQVGNITDAKKFYVDVLGMAITSEMPSALFVSDGKYHHHLGMNTWESLGAGPRTETLGLRSFEMWVEKEEDLEKLKSRLGQAESEFAEMENGVSVQDPWGNVVRLKVVK